MLDSGAFTSWTKGTPVDLEEYVAFCASYPDVSYYVSLDVISAKGGSRFQVEGSCQQGWNNYQRMLQDLPKEKVIPVFHLGDDVKWLDKYLSFGVPYIGLGGTVGSHFRVVTRWMKSVRPYIFDGAGRSIVKIHGFAVTDVRLIKYWRWYSVDSATWQRVAAMGMIYVPIKRQGKWVYDEAPLRVGVSAPRGEEPVGGCEHFLSMNPHHKEWVLEYLGFIGAAMGEQEKHYPVERNYRLKNLGVAGRETWAEDGDDEGKRAGVIRPIVKGVANSVEERLKVCVGYLRQAAKVLPLDFFYLAGEPLESYGVEYQCGNRLLSYAFLNNKGGQRCLEKHLESMRRYQCREQMANQ
jgi:hypothetical protein